MSASRANNGGRRPRLAERISAVLVGAERPLAPHEIARLVSADGGHRVSTLVVEQELLLWPNRFVQRGKRRWAHAARQPRCEPERANAPTGVGAIRRSETTSRTDWRRVLPKLYAWQVDALDAWERNRRRGIVQAVTGAGKTAVGAAAIEAHRQNGGATVVLVPTIELMEQWRRSLSEWLGVRPDQIARLGGGHREEWTRVGVVVAVAASAARLIPQRVAAAIRPVLLVADECHRYGAETFSRGLRAPYKATLGLSATPERGDEGMERAVIPALGDVIYRLGYRDAMAAGVINEFEVLFVALPFTPREQSEYDRYSTEITDRFDRLRARYPELAVAGDYLFDVLEEIWEEHRDLDVKAVLKSISMRRQVLHGAAARRQFVEWAFEIFPGRARSILFHELIEGAEDLAEMLTRRGIPARAHHSELPKDARRRILRDFERGTLRAIAAPRTLDEGIDVPDADFGIIVAGSKQLRQRIQRAGRVLRKAPGKGTAQVVILYVARTDEDPKARINGDRFARGIDEIGRAEWFRWPQERGRLAPVLVSGSQNGRGADG